MAENIAAAETKIKEEWSLNRLQGPYKSPPYLRFKACPLAIRQKSNGKHRLLHNLSFPYNEDAVNTRIPRENYKVKFASIQDAIDILKNKKGAYMAKTDIKDAFRILPIHEKDQHLLGFCFKGAYYFDRCLPMGCSSACKIFERISSAITHILEKKYRVANVVKYLDDFLFIGDTEEECLRALASFEHLCGRLGIPIAKHKTEGPSKRMIFLGYQLDSEMGLISIPKTKINNYAEQISSLLHADKTTLRETKSIIGKLLFVTNVVTIGRCFLRRLINLTCGKVHPASAIHLDTEVKEDLRLWLSFLKYYNGKHLMAQKPKVTSSSLHFFTDSCKRGYGGVFGRNHIRGLFPAAWRKLSIQVLELYPIYAMLHLYGRFLANCEVVFYCDNKSVVYNINKQSSKNKFIMKMLRPIIMLLLKYNFSLKARHIKGKLNTVADRISRGQVTPQFLRKRGMNPTPTPLPCHLRPQNFRL